VYRDSDSNDPKTTHRLLNGHRRWSAAVLCDISQVWAVEVPRPSETTRLLNQFEENERREGFSDMERAWALVALKDALQRDAGGEVPWSVIEEQLQLSPARRQDLLRLLRFSPEGQALIMRYGWSEWTLRPIHMAINAGTLDRDEAMDMLKMLAESPDVNVTVVGALVEGYSRGTLTTRRIAETPAKLSLGRDDSQSSTDLVQRMVRLRRASDQLRARLALPPKGQTAKNWNAESAKLREALTALLADLEDRQ